MQDYKADRDRLASSMEHTAERVEDVGATTAGKVAGTMRGMADNIRSFNANECRDRMMNAVDNARSGVARGVCNVKTGISYHPLESVVIAAGAGMLFGMTIAIMSRLSFRRRM